MKEERRGEREETEEASVCVSRSGRGADYM